MTAPLAEDRQTISPQRIRPVLDVATCRPVRDVILHARAARDEAALERQRSVQFLPAFESWPSPRRILLDDEAPAFAYDDHELRDATRQGSLDLLVELLADRVAALLGEKKRPPHSPSKNKREGSMPINVHDGPLPTTERVLVDATDAAAMLGISVNAVRLRTQRGQMPAGSVVRTGRRRIQYRVEALRSLRPYTKRSV